MRQRLTRLRRAIEEKYPRTHKIKDKAADIVVWTPILLLVYVNVALLTYRYSREDCKNDSILD